MYGRKTSILYDLEKTKCQKDATDVTIIKTAKAVVTYIQPLTSAVKWIIKILQ